MRVLLVSLLLSSVFLLTGATPWGEKNLPRTQNHTGDEKTYTYSESQVSNDGNNVKKVHSSFTDNSIHRNTNLPGNRDHTGDGQTYTYSDTRVSNNGRNVENVHSSFTDNSIHRNNANFEGASNVVIGNNKVSNGVFPQQTGAGPGNDRSSQGSGTQDYRNDGRTYTASDSRSGPNGNTRNVQTSYTDNTIRRDGANFDGARNVVIGNNKVPDGVFPQTNWGKPKKDNKQRQTQQEKPTIAGENGTKVLVSGGCSYVDGVIYENGERRNATPAEMEEARKWGEEMAEWGRQFDKYMTDKMSHMFDKTYDAGPKPKSPSPPCFCSPRRCETNSKNDSREEN